MVDMSSLSIHTPSVAVTIAPAIPVVRGFRLRRAGSWYYYLVDSIHGQVRHRIVTTPRVPVHSTTTGSASTFMALQHPLALLAQANALVASQLVVVGLATGSQAPSITGILTPLCAAAGRQLSPPAATVCHCWESMLEPKEQARNNLRK
jgi:hypothetical protein